jgi:agmatine deiminase
MTIDSKTNKLFLADCLQAKQPKFFQRFEKALNECNIKPHFLPKTKDIWAVDYMPIQVSKDKFIKFVYNPDYLNTPYYQKTISNVDEICKEIKIEITKSNLIIDGGNVVKCKNKVIMTDKVFNENKNLSKNEITKQLIELFEIEELIFVPWDINDEIGHADGMVRFINEDTVLINDYSKEDKKFQYDFKLAIDKARLNCVELPYSPVFNTNSISATGIYINYLQMKQAILFPIFNTKFDDDALKIIEECFKGQIIKTVESNDLAKKGGILNCITWNILD